MRKGGLCHLFFTLLKCNSSLSVGNKLPTLRTRQFPPHRRVGNSLPTTLLHKELPTNQHSILPLSASLHGVENNQCPITSDVAHQGQRGFSPL